PSPHMQQGSSGRLLATASELAEECRAALPDETKKEWGQYFTSAPIAIFMAGLVEAPRGRRTVRVLDPGAGTGILGRAISERLVSAAPSVPRGLTVHLAPAETEPPAAAQLEIPRQHPRTRLGARFSYEVLRNNFLDLDAPLLGAKPVEPFDVAIGNPPYFKVSP